MPCRLFLLAVLTVSLCACQKWLGIPPKGVLQPQTTEDYDDMLNDQALASWGATDALYLTDDTYLWPEQDPGSLGVNDKGGSAVGRMYTFQEGQYYTEAEADPYYEYAYHRIFIYNSVLDQVQQATVSPRFAPQQLYAEALASRAFEYLMLINLYAPHHQQASASSSYGVPLVLKADINAATPPRASVAAVYQQVEQDLRQALPNLPEDYPHQSPLRMTKVGAKAVLARCFLFQQRWQEALEMSSEIIKERPQLHDWTANTLVNPYGFIGRSDLPRCNENEEALLLRTCSYKYGLSTSSYFPEEVLKLFDQTNDQRYALCYSEDNFGDPLVDSNLRLYCSDLEVNTGLSTAEMYLIAAECHSRLGHAPEALALLDALRNHRIKGNTALSATTPEEALQLVLTERRREFYGNGAMRLIDLKRLAFDPATRKEITHKLPGGQSISVMPDDLRLVLPIVDKALQFNPDFKPRL